MKGEDSLGSSPWVLIRHVIAFDLLATRRENVLLLLTRRETSAPFQQRRHLRMRTELLYSSSYHSLLSLWARGNSQANCQLPSTEPRQSGLLFPWTWGFQAEMVFPFCLLSKYGKRLSTRGSLSLSLSLSFSFFTSTSLLYSNWMGESGPSFPMGELLQQCYQELWVTGVDWLLLSIIK